MRYWFDPRAKYAVEEIPDERCLRLIAERLLVRRMLGLGALDVDYENQVAAVGVFGTDTPLFSDLVQPNVFMAMAFVPLTPPYGAAGNPYLARLYCVWGLVSHRDLPLEGMNDPALQGYSWFIEGVPSDVLDRGIKGRSWLLAAHLLAEIVKNRDVQRMRNLMTHYIATGDVVGGLINKVEIDRKLELAQKKVFANFKWIIPIETKNGLSKEEVNEMSKKIECPATLEKAYELILTMQNEATKAMLSLLDKPNFAAFESQLKIGADIQAVRKDLNVRPLQAVTMQIDKLSAELGTIEDAKDPRAIDLRGRLSDLRKMKARLYREGAGAVFLFWNYAKAGRRDMIEELAKEYDVNSCDECGDSAVDMAIDAGDKDAEELLRSYGIHAGPYHRIDPKVNAALKELNTGKLSRSGALSISHAFDAGLSPETRIKWDDSGVDENGPYGAVWSPTLFEVLIAIGNVMLIERCISMGSDVNAKRTSYGYDPFDNEREELSRERVPLQWAQSEEVKDCLVRHGARLTANWVTDYISCCTNAIWPVKSTSRILILAEVVHW